MKILLNIIRRSKRNYQSWELKIIIKYLVLKKMSLVKQALMKFKKSIKIFAVSIVIMKPQKKREITSLKNLILKIHMKIEM